MKLCMNRWGEGNAMETDDALKTWRKRWLYNWIFFMYHFGGRPYEARALPLGDLEIQTMPFGLLKGDGTSYSLYERIEANCGDEWLLD